MAETTPTEANKALVQRYIEEASEKNYDVFEESVASDVVLHSNAPGIEEEVTGRDAYKALVQGYYEAFPDLTVTPEVMIAEDDLVADRATYSATHEGELMGTPATGKKVNFDGMAFFRIKDGKIAEVWAQIDTLGLMQQLGIVEPLGE